MALAALAGLGSGALHAVTGPDHVLSLAPLSARAGSRAWRLGLRWGLGHAAGTLAIALLALVLLDAGGLAILETWGDRLGAFALIITGILGLRARGDTTCDHARGATTVGLVHGLAGGAAVITLLPALLPPTPAHMLIYVAAFGAGSTIAMAALTRLLARVGSTRVVSRVLDRVSLVVCLASLALGSTWLATTV